MNNTLPITWKYAKHAKIRMAIVHVLCGIMKYSKKRSPLVCFVDSLNTIVGKQAIDRTTGFTEAIVRNAFCHDNNNSLIRCSDITGDDSIEGILHIRWRKLRCSYRNQTQSQYMYDLCLFPSIEEAIEGQRIADTARIAPATLLQTTINYDVVSAELMGSLLKFLEQEAKEIKKSVKRMAENKIAADTKLVEKRRRQSLDKEEEFGHNNNNSSNCKDNIQLLRAQVNEILSHRNEVQAQLDNIKHNLEVATATLTRAIDSSTCYNLCDSLTNDNMQPIYDCSRDDTSSKPLDGRICIQYYYGGKSGVLNFLAGHNQVLVEADFVKGLLPRREQHTDDEEEDAPPTIKTQFIGTKQYFTPSSHLLAIKNREQEKDKSREILASITTLFNSKICTWNDRAKGIVTIMNLFGYGCSDEATIFIMGGTLKAYFDDVGIDISTTQIANSLPARSTLGSWEIDTAADCLFGLCWGMRETGLSQLALTTDHGHRKGQDHLVKLLSFPERTSTGELSIGNFCLDVDSGGHTTVGAADAITLSVTPFLTILNRFLGDVKLSVITGDAGGGASVQNLHPALKTRKLMDSHSKRLSCDMHKNLNKAFEVACTDTWGQRVNKESDTIQSFRCCT